MMAFSGLSPAFLDQIAVHWLVGLNTNKENFLFSMSYVKTCIFGLKEKLQLI